MKNHKVVELLKRAYAGELETVENYLANSVWLDGLQADEEEHRCLFVGFLRSLEEHEARHAAGK